MPSIRCLSLLLIVPLLGACQTAPVVQEDPHQQLLKRNPALSTYYAQNPGAAGTVLRDVQALMKRPINPSIRLPQKERSVILPGDDLRTAQQREQQRLIETLKINPALREIYKRDQKATVKLIKLIQD